MKKITMKQIIYLLISAALLLPFAWLSYKSATKYDYAYVTKGSRDVTEELSQSVVILQEVPGQAGDLGLSFIFSTYGHKVSGEVTVSGVGKKSGIVYFEQMIPGNGFKNNEYVNFFFSAGKMAQDETIEVSFTATSDPTSSLRLLTTDDDEIPDHALIINGFEQSCDLSTRRILPPRNAFFHWTVFVIVLLSIPIFAYLLFIFLKTVKRYLVGIKRNKQYTIKLVMVILGCMVMEGGVFNYPALSTRNLEQDNILISRNSSKNKNEIIIEDVKAESSTVYASFSGPKSLMTVQAWITDDASRDQFVLCDEARINPGHKDKHDVVLRVESNGKIHSLKLTWNKNNTNLEDLTINVPVPYEFNPVRFMIMLVICFAIVTIRFYHMNRFVFDPSDPRQLLIYTAIMLVCVGLTVIVYVLIKPENKASVGYSSAVGYPFNNISSETYKIHAVMFDSLFHNGIVQVEPSKELLDLENPFDPSQRLSGNVHYLFDYALFNGKYYSYFGLTPVLVFYSPFYFIHGSLPSYMVAALFFAILTVIGCFVCVWELAKLFSPETSALLLFAVAPAVALGSNVLMLQSCPDRYYLSIQSMQAFFFLTLWAGFKAVRINRRMIRSFYFILCAVFTFFLVWSRPTGAIIAAGWIVPLFISVLINRENSTKNKFGDILSFMIPLCAGAFVIMNYNLIRFGSPFEFGQYYQLTTEDIHYNRVKLRDLFAALWYYFIDGYILKSEFPWVQSTNSFTNHSGNFFYGPLNTGALIMPISWGICLLTKGFSDSDKDRKINAIIYSALLMTVVVALMDYCIAGVAQRYSCDIQPALCLAGALLIMKNAGRDFRDGKLLAVRVCWLLCIVTYIIAFCLIFSNYRQFIYKYSPDKYLFFVNMLSFR